MRQPPSNKTPTTTKETYKLRRESSGHLCRQVGGVAAAYNPENYNPSA